MEKLILSPRTEIFTEKNGISWKEDQNSETEFPNGKCAFQLLVSASLRPFGLDCLWSYLPGKSLGNGTSASPWKFSCRIWHVLLTTIFRVNGKRPLPYLSHPTFAISQSQHEIFELIARSPRPDLSICHFLGAFATCTGFSFKRRGWVGVNLLASRKVKCGLQTVDIYKQTRAWISWHAPVSTNGGNQARKSRLDRLSVGWKR